MLLACMVPGVAPWRLMSYACIMAAITAGNGKTFELTFGDRLRRARLNLGLDQRDFAKGIDMHHATVSRYEHDGGRGDSSTRRVALLIQLRYGVSADWLLYGTVPEQRGEVTGEYLSLLPSWDEELVAA